MVVVYVVVKYVSTFEAMECGIKYYFRHELGGWYKLPC